ncbi:hypothetical protein MVEN_00408600 [Mycena venus]|uniref:Uncharacterized protein n=1 Tax=Mycena venus TaxID=2733690 RepID=A0A8H7D7Q3_9AGAR|nr:hypothetical protein MVEN_00408600 [Mycena venus]
MGFFFSRKSDPAEDTASSKEFGRPVVANNESGFKSLRSRFNVYAKKLDAKERDSPPLFVQASSVAATLSPPTPATPIANRQLELKLKLSSSSPALNPTRKPSRSDRAKSANNSPTTNRHTMQVSDSEQRPSSSRSRALGTKASSSSLASTPTRNPTDAVTTTLAQRLNELAVANSEGLLNDDEYRLLRQDLFQRFASTTTVPTEVPVVPLASPQNLKSRSSVRVNGATIPTDKRQSIDSKRVSISTSSNFYVEKQRTPSVHSRTSMTSGVASFFRRATGRHSSHDYSETSSIFSSTSKRLSKKTSASSLTTDRGDSMSISSRRTNNLSAPTEPSNPTASIRSVRRLPTPPSSFPTRLPGVESRFAGMGPETDTNPDVEGPETVAALRREIQAVEAEGRRLMDAFNGLELSTITKRRRTAITGPRDSSATLVPDARSMHSVSVAGWSRRGSDAADRDGDASSMRSATSAGTTPSVTSRRAASTHRSGGGSSLKPGGHGPVVHAAGFVSSASSSRVGSLHRKNSGSSVGSTHTSSRLGIGAHAHASASASHHGHGVSGSGGLMVPPVPPLPLGMSLGQLGSTPSLSRSTGHLPMGVVHEGEAVLTVDLDDEREFGLEMEDLRRRRDEVAGRYEARLEYLRAKLKGAELHEKLLSK